MGKTHAIQTAIRAELDRRGWSQSELARRIGIPQQHVSRMLSSRMDPRCSTVERALAALDLSISPGSP
jgi:transcriptional regulator with XRE-family HTH domain